MDITNRFKNAVAAFRKVENADSRLGLADGNAFLKYGSRRMPSTWSIPEINDEDFYTGYGFAVINKRANRSVVLGKKFLFTEAKEEIMKTANEKGERVTHPYLTLIQDSIDFAQRDFWYDISTYLDLEGIYYLMAVRTVTASGKVGNIQKFSLLNPYWVRPIINSKGDLGGYVEHNPNKGERDIPPEMIIPIKLLNPFDPAKTFSLADAARDSQFTMKQANDYARESINGNINAPGILSSAIELPDDQFDNFVDRVKNHGRGEPLFGNGAGTVSWVDMQTDLDKAALDKINSINRDVLLAISGLSKTGVGVEESGTGREVSRTQKDDFTENAIMPQIENIIDALNLDYRRYYPEQYSKNNYTISLDNPLETDRDAEQADVEIRDSQFVLLNELIDKGYDYDIASKYAKGLIDITDLGEPKNPPVVAEDDTTPVGDGTDPNEPDLTPPADPVENTVPFYENSNTDMYEGYAVPVVQYLGDLADQIIPKSETLSIIHAEQAHDKVRIAFVAEFYQHLIGVVDENTYVALGEFKKDADREAIISRLNKRYHNQLVAVKKKFKQASDQQDQLDRATDSLLTSVKSAEQALLEEYLHGISIGDVAPGGSLESYINGLSLPFATWFTVMFPVYASQRAQETASELDVNDIPITLISQDIKAQINTFAQKEAESHMKTIQSDLDNALKLIKANTSDPAEIARQLQLAFVDIQKRRAPLIAQNASNRIFALSQYEADLQLLSRQGLLSNAYKQLFSSTGNPCPICEYIIVQTQESPIPFTQEFVSKGEHIDSHGEHMDFDFEGIIAGNVHPWCHCYYKIIIKTDEQNSLRVKTIENRLEEIDGRSKEARELKEELAEIKE